MEFLKATRFWVMLLGCVSATLIDPSFPVSPWYLTLGKLLSLLSAGFITVRTVDRASEQLGGDK